MLIIFKDSGINKDFELKYYIVYNTLFCMSKDTFLYMLLKNKIKSV